MMKKQSLDRRMMISKNSILMLVLLVIVFIAVWAWFAGNTEVAQASGLSASTKTPSTLELALPNEDGSYPEEDSAYSSSIDFDKQISIIRTMVTDVTSDGLHFIIPTTTQESGVRIVEKDQAWDKAVANQDYISIPFYVRSQNQNIYVSGSSKLDATLQDDSGKIVNESDVTGLSRNGIVGAMRVSIVDMTNAINTENYQPADRDLKFFWVPRPDLYLSTPTDNNWALITKVKEDTELKGATAGDTYKHYYWAIRQKDEINSSRGTGVDELSYPTKNKTEDWFWVSDYPNEDINQTPTLGTNRQIGNGQIYDSSASNYVDMEKVTMNGTDYYVYKFVMNVWVEGTDAEARRALNNGEFKLDIKFNSGTD